MAAAADTVNEVVEALSMPPCALEDTLLSLPRAKELYAWWGAPQLPGSLHPADSVIRLLYVDLVTNLHTRITRNHMRRVRA